MVININQNHWILHIVYLLLLKEVHGISSMKSTASQFYEPLLKYLEISAEHEHAAFDALEWQFMDIELAETRQSIGYDCGMFVLSGIEHLLAGLPFSYRQEDMPYFQNRMT